MSGEPTTLVLAMTKTYGGAEESLRVLLQRLVDSRRARRVVLIHDHERLAGAAADRRRRVAVNATDAASRLAAPGNAVALAIACVRARPALVLANGFRSTLVLAALSCFLAQAARVVYVHDASRRGLDALLRWIRPRLVLVPSPALVPRYAGRYRTVGVQAFEPPKTAPAARERTAGTPLRVALVANLVRLKGVEHAIAAVARLAARGIAVTLTVYGSVVDRGYADEIAALARAAGDHVRLAGFQSIERIYADCDVALVTTVSLHGGPETFGRSIVDAYERGVPVVAFACGGPAWLVANGRSGLLVPEGDDAALAAALERLALDGDLYRRCSAGALAERHRLQRRLDRAVERIVGTRLFSATPCRSRR